MHILELQYRLELWRPATASIVKWHLGAPPPGLNYTQACNMTASLPLLLLTLKAVCTLSRLGVLAGNHGNTPLQPLLTSLLLSA